MPLPLLIGTLSSACLYANGDAYIWAHRVYMDTLLIYGHTLINGMPHSMAFSVVPFVFSIPALSHILSTKKSFLSIAYYSNQAKLFRINCHKTFQLYILFLAITTIFSSLLSYSSSVSAPVPCLSWSHAG